MFTRYLERKDARRLQKQQMKKEQQRLLLIILGVLGAILLFMSVLEMLTQSEEPSKTPTPVSTVSAPEQPELSDAERFADIVTKPVETLTSDDLAFLDSKAEDPCYAENAMLPPEEMTVAILACEP